MVDDLTQDAIDAHLRERRRTRRLAANTIIILGALIAVAAFGLANNPSVTELWQSVSRWVGIVLIVVIAGIASITYYPKGMSPAQYLSFWNW